MFWLINKKINFYLHSNLERPSHCMCDAKFESQPIAACADLLVKILLHD